MAKYFTIWQGLRGCYMPDSAWVVRCETRKELKAALWSEARDITDAGGVGLSKRNVATLAATAWRNAGKAHAEYVAPYRWKDQTYYPYALGVFTGATRQEYLAQAD